MPAVHILLLNDDYPPHARGGAAMIVQMLAHAYKKDGHRVTVLTTIQEGSDCTYEDNGITVHALSVNYHRRWRAYKSLRHRKFEQKIINELKKMEPIDAVHIHNIHEYMTYRSLMIAKRHAKKVILTFHDVMSVAYGKLRTKRYLRSRKGTFDYKLTLLDHWKQAGLRWNPLRNMRIRRALRFADKKIAVSHALANALRANGVYADDVIHNGIELIDVNLSKREEGKKKIFFGGRIGAEKGIMQAFDTLLALPKEIDATLIIAGDKEKAEKYINVYPRKHELKAKIECTGWLDRNSLFQTLAACDVCITPSIYCDPFPTINLESMALGVSVVTTCYGGSPEAVKEGETGFVVDPFETKGFAAALEKILSDPKRAEEMGGAGKKRILDKFSLAAQAKAYIDLLGS